MNPGGGSLCLFPGSWILLRRTDVFIQYHTMCCDGCTSYLGEIGTDYILKSSIGRRIGTTEYIAGCTQDTIVGDFRVFISNEG